jgi:putative membrane protein
MELHMQEDLPGREPDYRFSLANERTFLAWIRTSLALLGGGLLVHQFGTRIEPDWLRLGLSSSFMLSAAALAVGAFRQWGRNQQAMRLDQPLPRSPTIISLAIFIATLSMITLGFLIW